MCYFGYCVKFQHFIIKCMSITVLSEKLVFLLLFWLQNKKNKTMSPFDLFFFCRVVNWALFFCRDCKLSRVLLVRIAGMVFSGTLRYRTMKYIRLMGDILNFFRQLTGSANLFTIPFKYSLPNKESLTFWALYEISHKFLVSFLKLLVFG